MLIRFKLLRIMYSPKIGSCGGAGCQMIRLCCVCGGYVRASTALIFSNMDIANVCRTVMSYNYV